MNITEERGFIMSNNRFGAGDLVEVMQGVESDAYCPEVILSLTGESPYVGKVVSTDGDNHVNVDFGVELDGLHNCGGEVQSLTGYVFNVDDLELLVGAEREEVRRVVPRRSQEAQEAQQVRGFGVGDRVVVDEEAAYIYSEAVGLVGEVVALDVAGGLAVDFGVEKARFHSCGGRLRTMTGYYIPANVLNLVSRVDVDDEEEVPRIQLGASVQVSQESSDEFVRGYIGKVVFIEAGMVSVDFGVELDRFHTAGGVLSRRTGYHLSPRDLEVIDSPSDVEEIGIEVNDVVVVKAMDAPGGLIGRKGRVFGVRTGLGSGVRFAVDFGVTESYLHDCGGNLPHSSGYYLPAHQLEKVGEQHTDSPDRVDLKVKDFPHVGSEVTLDLNQFGSSDRTRIVGQGVDRGWVVRVPDSLVRILIGNQTTLDNTFVSVISPNGEVRARLAKQLVMTGEMEDVREFSVGDIFGDEEVRMVGDRLFGASEKRLIESGEPVRIKSKRGVEEKQDLIRRASKYIENMYAL